MATGGANFNNLWEDCDMVVQPEIDFAQHAQAQGAVALKVASIGDLEAALETAKTNPRTSVIVIDTHPLITTEAGGYWWDVVVPEVSPRTQVGEARARYETARSEQRKFD